MKLIQLSDLHPNGQCKNEASVLVALRGRWLELRTSLGLATQGASIDYLLLTGDLSNSARPFEYSALLAFLLEDVRPSLTDGDLTRVVVVPGNHDVDWSARVLSARSFNKTRRKKKADLRLLIDEYWKNPAAGGVRVVRNSALRLEYRQLRHDLYCNRLKRFQNELVDKLYENTLKSPCKKMNLLGEQIGDDWSAHVFPEDGLAIFGFNSCNRSDQYWTGALISEIAIQNATEWIDRHDLRKYTLIAMWHHGMHSEYGHPDHLDISVAQTLMSRGFKIGFHGHVHKNVAEHSYLEDSRFIIISSGSFLAEKDNRPDATPNQFNLVSLVGRVCFAETFDRDPEKKLFERRKVRRYSLNDHARIEKRVIPRVESQNIEWKVTSTHLISQVTFRYNGIPAGVRLDVASLPGDQSFRQAMPTRDAMCTRLGGEEFLEPITEASTESNSITYSIALPEGRMFQSLEWQLLTADPIGLSRADIECLPDEHHLTGAPKEAVCICHHLQFDCDRFVLSIRLPREKVRGVVDVSACVVERAGAKAARVPSEERRCTIRRRMEAEKFEKDGVVVDGAEIVIELSVEGPVVGYRYGVYFTPMEVGTGLTHPEKALLRNLVDECRSTPASVCDNRTDIAFLLGRNFRDEFRLRSSASPPANSALLQSGSLLGTKSHWMIHLWDPTLRLLVPATGEFPRQRWNTVFRSGEGIAGVAFRQKKILIWHPHIRFPRNILFKPKPTGVHGEPIKLNWLLCIPLCAQSGASIGVVSFAGEDTNDMNEVSANIAELVRVESNSNGRLEFGRCVQDAFRRAISRLVDQRPGLRPAFSTFMGGSGAAEESSADEQN